MTHVEEPGVHGAVVLDHVRQAVRREGRHVARVVPPRRDRGKLVVRDVHRTSEQLRGLGPALSTAGDGLDDPKVTMRGMMVKIDMSMILKTDQIYSHRFIIDSS